MANNEPTAPVIDLTKGWWPWSVPIDDSFIGGDSTHLTIPVVETIDITTPPPKTKTKSSPKRKKDKKTPAETKPPAEERDRSPINFGDCPICYDALGRNDLVSTKCGHVFCATCLKQSLKRERKCPTCRTILRGNTAFHPLYLGNR